MTITKIIWETTYLDHAYAARKTAERQIERWSNVDCDLSVERTTEGKWRVRFDHWEASDGTNCGCRRPKNHQHCMDGSGVNYVWCYELTHCPSDCECSIGECDSKIKF